ncbi:hypothetical protein [Photobacterium damselae]
MTIILAMCWPIYSYVNFGRFFVTENSLLFRQNLPVVDVLYFDYPKFNNLIQIIELVIRRVFLLLVFLIPFTYIINLRKKESLDEELSCIYCNASAFTLVFISLTGYTDSRYFAIASVFFIRHIFLYLLPVLNKAKIAKILLTATVAMIVLLTCARVYLNTRSGDTFTKVNVTKCIKKDDVVLIVSDNKNNGRLLSSKLSTLYGFKTIMEPTNLKNDNAKTFMDKFNVKYIYHLDNKPKWLNNTDSYIETNCNSLYQVKLGH